jgi:uncharacterized tellurite resistance protein B-like protein
MTIFFKSKKKDGENDNSSYSKIAALLVYTAKVDENYEDKEREIIKKTLIELGADSSNIVKVVADAEIIEANSNQILDFTKEVKNMSEPDRVKIIESLWKIIYSDNSADIYEANLMRRLAGLLYIDARTMGELKQRVKKELLK